MSVPSAEDQISALVGRARKALEADPLDGDLGPIIRTLRKAVALRKRVKRSSTSKIVLEWLDDLEIVIEAIGMLEAVADSNSDLVREGPAIVDKAYELWNRPGMPRTLGIMMMQRVLGTMARTLATSSKPADRKRALDLGRKALGLIQWWQLKPPLAPLAKLMAKLEGKPGQRPAKAPRKAAPTKARSPTKAEVVDFKTANKRFDLRAYLQAWNDDDVVHAHPKKATLKRIGDLHTSCHFCPGDLSVTGDIVNNDSDLGGFLVVLGDLRARNLISGGAQVYVGGNLIIENAIIADYNHGHLEVKGDVRAAILTAEHTVTIDGTLKARTVDFGGLDVSKRFIPDVSHTEATQNPRKYFVREVLAMQGYVEGGLLIKRALAGKPILK